jgi:hypothetical protein
MRVREAGDRRRLATVATSAGLLLAAALPASAPAAGLIAAFDRYETGKGFEIGLLNASTGAPLTLPDGVNTTDDELHPALSVDGRFLLFERMRLLPKLNGDIVPPAARTVHLLDRQTGIVTTLATGSGAPAGATFVNRPERAVAWGVRPTSTSCCVVKFQGIATDNTIAGSTGFPLGFGPAPAGQLLDVPHAAIDQSPFNLYFSWVVSDANTGGLVDAGTVLYGRRAEAGGSITELRSDFGSAQAPTRPRPATPTSRRSRSRRRPR